MKMFGLFPSTQNLTKSWKIIIFRPPKTKHFSLPRGERALDEHSNALSSLFHFGRSQEGRRMHHCQKSQRNCYPIRDVRFATWMVSVGDQLWSGNWGWSVDGVDGNKVIGTVLKYGFWKYKFHENWAEICWVTVVFVISKNFENLNVL